MSKLRQRFNINKNSFDHLLEKSKGKNIAIVPHANPDLDAITTAIVLAEFMKYKQIANPDILIQNKPDRRVPKLLNYIKANHIIPNIISDESTDLNKIINGYDDYVVVDTNSCSRIPLFNGMHMLGVIDHHNLNAYNINSEFHIFDLDARATAELLARLILSKDPSFLKQSKIMSTLLAIGIFSDSAALGFFTPQTLYPLATLQKYSGISDFELNDFITPELNELEIKRNIESIRNSKHYKIGKHNIYITETKGSEQMVVDSLIMLGSDFAFVGKDYGSKTHISARSRFINGFDLADFMTAFGLKYGGDGSGHHGIAGATVYLSIKEALSLLYNMLKKELETYNQEINR